MLNRCFAGACPGNMTLLKILWRSYNDNLFFFEKSKGS